MADRNALQVTQPSGVDIRPEEMSVVEKLIINGDLSALQPQERITYYLGMCRAGKLNPLNRPFDYLMLDGRLVLYTNKRGSDEIRSVNNVSIEIVEAKREGPVYRVTARATLTNGRTDTATGAVPIVKQEITGWEKTPNGKNRPIKGDTWVDLDPMEYANAIMKAETKAKRRVALSAVGLGVLDESELDTIPRAQRVAIDHDTGEIIEALGNPSPSPRSIGTPEDAWERASKRLHAVAGEHGVNHDALHNWAVGTGNQSIRDVSTTTLNNLADNFQNRPDYALERFAKYMEQEPEPIDIEPRPITTGPPTAEEMDAALAASTPTSLPFDVPDARKYQ